MTPDAQQPQREYGCSEAGIWTACKDCDCLPRCERGQKETRPHTPALEQNMYSGENGLCKITKNECDFPNILHCVTCPIFTADNAQEEEELTKAWMKPHNAAIARAATLATLDKLQAWRIRRMNGMLKKDVWKGWNEETDFIDSLRRTAQQEHP